MISVTITAQDDGTYTVEEAGAPEQGMDMPMDALPQDAMDKAPAFGTLDEALDEARMVLAGPGGMDAAPAMMEGEDEFLAGFNGVRPQAG